MAMIRTYTETYDMNTEEGSPTLLGIHTPIGNIPYTFLAPAFRMYKKYKYLGCDITVVNAARLPVDPEQLGKIEGTNYVDPRDTLNPIMFKGCHGESMGAILDSMYDGLLMTHKGSALDKEKLKAGLEAFYYTALGDDGWRKSPIQKTLSLKGLHPMVYSLSTNHQILPTNGLALDYYRENVPTAPTGTASVGVPNGAFTTPGNSGPSSPVVDLTGVWRANGDDESPTLLRGVNSLFTSKMHRLGWLDTLQYVGRNGSITNPLVPLDGDIAQLPKVFMGLLMLPPSYLCRQYLRVIIRHKFKFAGYRTITTGGAIVGNPETNLGNYGYWYTGNLAGESKVEDAKELPEYDQEVLESDDDGE